MGDDETTWAGTAFDQPPSSLTRLIVIGKTPRAGSHLLGRLLYRFGLGLPLEYYNGIQLSPLAQRWRIAPTDPAFPREYLQAVIRHRTIGGICAIHAGPRQFPPLAEGLDSWTEPLPLSFIHLWRRDTLAQAISLRLSHQSGYWDSTAEPTSTPAPHLDMFDLEALREKRRWLLQGELWWRAELRKRRAPVIHVAFEDLLGDRMGVLRRIVATLAPERAGGPWPESGETDSPDTLRARQSLNAEQRRTLYDAYTDRYGPLTPLPDP